MIWLDLSMSMIWLNCQVIKSKSDFSDKPYVFADRRTHFDVNPGDFAEDFSSNL